MAMPDVADAPAGPEWDEGLWDELLAYIEAGIVVPIIGPGSYRLDIDGRTMAFDSYVAERLAAKLSLPLADAGPAATLNGVVSAFLGARGRRAQLYPMIQGIIEEARLAPPPVLKQLAEIRQFNLFVTTGCDPLLEMAINEVRYGGEPRCRTLVYAPNKVQDIPAAIGEDDPPIVYHLFGKASNVPYSYAISDEDLIEFLHALQSESRRPENLLSRLENENLLLIGANFPDWVARIFLRTAKGKRLSDSRGVEYLAENHSAREPSLVAFLTHFSTNTQIFHGETDKFVAELSRRWRARHDPRGTTGEAGWVPPPADMPEHAIFISYAREDIAAVRALKEAIQAAGLTVWFDFDRLGPGDTFDPKIEDNIRRCWLFVPVLSRNTQARREGSFRREWNYALDRDLNIDPAQRFILPVAIDDTVDIAALPRRYRQINLTMAPQGRPSPSFIAELKQMSGRP
jgi:hypothetical protein